MGAAGGTRARAERGQLPFCLPSAAARGENCQQESCKAFIGLTIWTKVIGRNVPFYLKLERNCGFSIYFARSVSAMTSSKKVHLTLIGIPLHFFQ